MNATNKIKFRGYGADHKQWFLGFGVNHTDYTDGSKDWHIYTQNGVFKVCPESIGQFTGLKDKNGTEIYEGDVLTSVASHQKESGLVVYGEGAIVFKVISSRTTLPNQRFHLSTCKELEVIGVIYENPELLEENK